MDGQTETPDFSIDISNQPVPLSTRFKAIVDGTNGDTWLDRVDAKLGESNIVASGAIVRDRDVKGRHVALDIKIHEARIEDVLRLAVKADKAPLTGRMEMTTTFLLPAGEAGRHRSIEPERSVPPRSGALQQHQHPASHRGAEPARARQREPGTWGRRIERRLEPPRPIRHAPGEDSISRN